MSDSLTKQDVRDIIREEVPQIVTEAIKANNEMIFAVFKTEILGIYEEFGKVHDQFKRIDERFDKMDAILDKQDKSIKSVQKDVKSIKTDLNSFKKKTSHQFQNLHADLTEAISYRPIIKDHSRRIYALEQGMVQDKKQ